MNKIILQAALSSEYKLCKVQNVVLKPEIVHTTQAGNQFSSVQFSRSVVSNSLQPHELQHARPPCPSPSRFSCVQLFETLCSVACQAPLSKGLSRHEYWSGLPCSPPGDLLIQGSNQHLLCFLNWEVGSLPLVPP